MSEMVERVARAIETAIRAEGGTDIDIVISTGLAECLALAAIKAMEDPTMAMVKAEAKNYVSKCQHPNLELEIAAAHGFLTGAEFVRAIQEKEV